MAQFTIIQPSRVIRVEAKSIQALTRALKAVGQRWLGIHEHKED